MHTQYAAISMLRTHNLTHVNSSHQAVSAWWLCPLTLSTHHPMQLRGICASTHTLRILLLNPCAQAGGCCALQLLWGAQE